MHPNLVEMGNNIKSNSVQLNEHLLKSLPQVLGMTHADVATAAGIANTTWYRLIKDPQKFTVQQLLYLSNGLHIPVSKFFCRQSDAVGKREDYVVNIDYKTCYYNSDAVSKLIKEKTTISWRDAADAMGVHVLRVKESLLAVHRLPVVRLIIFCDFFNLDLFNYIIDPNSATTSNNQNAATASYSLVLNGVEGKPEINLAMHLELYELRKHLFDTKQEVSILRRKQNPNNMIKNEIKAPVTFFSGIRILYDTTDLTEPLHTWFQKLIVKSPYDTFFFAKTGSEYNSVRFYTEDGIMFYEAECESDLANHLFREGIMAGKINADSVKENNSVIELHADLVANAREDRKDTADLARFREAMIQKFG